MDDESKSEICYAALGQAQEAHSKLIFKLLKFLNLRPFKKINKYFFKPTTIKRPANGLFNA